MLFIYIFATVLCRQLRRGISGRGTRAAASRHRRVHHTILQAQKLSIAAIIRVMCQKLSKALPAFAKLCRSVCFCAASLSASSAISPSLDMAAIHPTPKVSEFYDFFSFSHLTAPILNLRRYERKEGEKRDDKNLQWKACTSSCISKGGLYFGKAVFPRPLPGGSSAKSQSSFCQSEDENWGGNGGGRRRDGEHDMQPWATEFAILAWLPCETEEERVVRDWKAFLLHNQFVDVSIFKAVGAISRFIDSNLHTQDAINDQKGAILH